MSEETVTLWRPVGPEELELIRRSGGEIVSDGQTVGKLLKGAGASITACTRFEVGEGISVNELRKI